MKKLLLFLLCTFLVSSCGGVTPIPTATSTATMHPSNPPTSIPINKPAPVEIAITHPELEVITPENVHRIELIDRWGKGMVYGVELSPDGSQIAVGTSTGVYFYDRITAEPIGFINLPVAPNVKYNECNLQDKNISFSPDGRFLAIADIDINIWDLSANKLHKTITNKVAEPASIITEVKFSLDGSRIVTLQKSNHNDGRCYMGWRSFLIYDANSGEQIFRQDFEGSDEFPRFFRFDKNEVVKFLNPSIKGLEISSVDLFTGRIVKEDVIQMRHSALNFEGSIVVDWELNDNTNHLIDTNTNEEIRVVSDLVTILPVTQFVLVGQQNFVLQTLQGDLVCSFSNPDDIAPHRLRSFTKDGNMGLSWDDNRGEIRIWDFKNCTISDPILYFQEFERQLKFSPDGRSLLANSRGGYGYFILDAQSGDFRYTVETRNVYKVYGVDFSAGGRKIAVYNEDAIVEYDAVTGVKKGTLFVLERGFLGGRLEFNPNGSMVIYDDRNSTLLRGTLYGETIRNSSQGSFRFSADGSTLITFSGTENGTEISLLNLITGEETKGADLLPSVYPGFMAINHELSYLAVWDRKTVSLWKLPDVYLEKVFVITDSDTQGLAGPILFSPDDKLLLAAGYSPNEILFWNVETGQFLHSIPASETALELGYHIVMSPDGRLLATMGNDGTIRIWGVKK